MALRTWEGVTEPAEQADPLLAQMPSMSKAAITEMLSAPLTEKEMVLLRTFFMGDLRSTELKDSRACRMVEILGSRWPSSNTGVMTKDRKADTKPPIRGRFSVPARLSFS